MEKFVFRDIKEAFEYLQNYAEEYQHKDLQNELAQIAITEDCKIAIVANKNEDKMTFIEAFGEEIPPESTLSDADIALFIFDYEQLDANLSDDEQGLWHAIQERAGKDKDFEVFFVLDKIDKALDDNAKNESEWFYHEQKAIDKLEDVAKTLGNCKPKTYAVSSFYSILHCKTGKDFDEDEKLKEFKKNFKQEFSDEWEPKLIEYVGIEKFKEIKDHIAEKPNRRLGELASRIQKMIDVERERIEKEIKSLEWQAKDNAEERKRQLKERRETIDESINKSNGEKEEMSKKIEELEKRLKEVAAFYSEKMEKLVDMHIQRDMLNPIDEMTKKTLAFVEHYAAGHNKMLSKLHAKTNAAKMLPGKNNSFLLIGISKFPEEVDEESEAIIIKILTEIRNRLNDISSSMRDFIQEMLIDCKNNYMNIHNEIREIYKEIDSKLSSSIEISNNALEKTKEEKSTAKWWNPLTWFDSKKAEEYTMIMNGVKPEIDVNSILILEMENPGSFDMDDSDSSDSDSEDSDSIDAENSDGILKYHLENPYEEISTGTLLNPFTWGDTQMKKTKDEEHFIVINGIKLKNAIEQKVLENIEKLKNAEIQNYKDNIEQIYENIKELPRVSNTANKEQIEKLSLEIKEIDKQIDDINKQKAKKEKERTEQQTQLQKQLNKLNANPLCQS